MSINRDFDDDMAKFRENPDADDDEEEAAVEKEKGSDESGSDSDEEVSNNLNSLNRLLLIICFPCSSLKSVK